MKEYQEFLLSKQEKVTPSGFDVAKEDINKILFPFQRDIVIWALKMGKVAVFADCGMGKSFIQIEYGYHVNKHLNKPVLFVSPLAVAGQTIEEANKLGYDMHYARSMLDLDGTEELVITNYEMVKKFRMDYFGALVLDESSILKNFTGKMRNMLIKMAQKVDYRLALTATPAPNDTAELGNHAEFLGVMKRTTMLRRYFYHDSGDVHVDVLKPHARNQFWGWVASWAVSLRKPSDIGNYSDDGYILPELVIEGEIVPVDHTRAWNEVNKKNGQMSLLLVGNTSATNMHREKKNTMKNRMKMAADKVHEILASNPDESIVVWCEYNYEADELIKLLPDAVEVRGNESVDNKQKKLLGFTHGEYQVLITKPKIAAHGLNWQHCGHQVWTSITHKFEPFYQGYKRSHRFGRKGPVHCHIIYAESEGAILANMQRKHAKHELESAEMVRAMRENGMSLEFNQHVDRLGDWGDVEHGGGWTLYHGDSALSMRGVESNSTDLIVQSPPFESIFTYSENVEDLGNCATSEQFYQQYQYILQDELRRLKPGAIKCEHCQDLSMLKSEYGKIGLLDFPGRLIDIHLASGYWFIGVKTVWKDPVVEMQRTKRLGLLWSKSFCEATEQGRQGIADYILVFQKPVEGQDPPATEIDQMPLPRSVVDRCVDLWSNKGENVQSPYHKIKGETPIDLMIVEYPDMVIQQIESIKYWLRDGRLLVCRVNDFSKTHNLIKSLHKHDLIFHSRISLTDGTFLVVFRKWVHDMSDKNPNIVHVTHDLVAPTLGAKNPHEFIGNNKPSGYSDDRGYSIYVWQYYASPVWFDLDGLPESNPNIWMDVQQTNVLEYRTGRDEKDEKHIAPLQLDVIRKCIEEYTNEGNVVSTSFAGIGSEIAMAVEMNRLAYGSELKESYFELAIRNIKQIEISKNQASLFDLAQYEVMES